jgi:hypothetical protein
MKRAGTPFYILLTICEGKSDNLKDGVILVTLKQSLAFWRMRKQMYTLKHFETLRTSK